MMPTKYPYKYSELLKQGKIKGNKETIKWLI